MVTANTGLLFTLADEFVEDYRSRDPEFGFGELGRVTFVRTYARHDNPRLPVVGTDRWGQPDHKREEWVDVCRRVTEGTFSILLEHVRDNGIEGWNPEQVSDEARSFFDLMFRMCWTPPGRGLWMMGTPFVHERGVYEALQNCGFASTESIARDGGAIFAWAMDKLMVGVGIGMDMRGKGKVRVIRPEGRPMVYDIPDSRAGWAESVRLLVDSYLDGSNPVEFSYHLIRPRGTPIRGFGGYAEGPEILEKLHGSMRRVLDRNAGERITTETLADLTNLIGRCVVAGNVRRSAEILLGEPNDLDFISLKNAAIFPERNNWDESVGEIGWAGYSNNTVFAKIGMDYAATAERTYANGEPGYVWLENVNRFGRMDGVIDTRDEANGGNPCLEQLLEPWELCTLVDLHLPRIPDKTTFLAALKAGYLYGKIVTLASSKISDRRTREVMTKNRRIGESCTGITQFMYQFGNGGHEDGIRILEDWMDHGYHMTGYWDKRWSQWLEVPESVRRTSVKPSGTVALLSGTTAGIHYPIGRYWLKRMRVSSNSALWQRAQQAGYEVEPDVTDPTGTMVITFPVDLGVDMPGEDEVDPRDHLILAAMVNRVWADNSTSITVKFNPKKESPVTIALMLRWAESRFKSISFLRDEPGLYPQMPQTRILRSEYEVYSQDLKPIDLDGIQHEMEDEFCDSDGCLLPVLPGASLPVTNSQAIQAMQTAIAAGTAFMATTGTEAFERSADPLRSLRPEQFFSDTELV